jgi:hypothetical protein
MDQVRPQSGSWQQTTLTLDWPTCPFRTPSGGGRRADPGQKQAPGERMSQVERGIDKQRPVTEALLIHLKWPVRAGLGAILRERHGTSIASSDDDTAAAV